LTPLASPILHCHNKCRRKRRSRYLGAEITGIRVPHGYQVLDDLG
jgi:hypothetical protein